MSESNIVYAGVGIVFTFLLGIFGWNVKKAHDKIDAFPEKYIMKKDYYKDQNIVRDELKYMREDFKEGIKDIRSDFNGGVKRLYDKIEAKKDK